MTRIRPLAAIPVLALALAACGGGGEESRTPESSASSAPTVAATTPVETSAEPSTPESTAETTATATPPSDLPEGVTPPGTVLSYGETATLQYVDAVGYVGTIELTVPAPVEGGEADYADAETTLPEGSTPYFVTSTAVGVDEDSAELRTIDFMDLRAFDANGSSLMGAVDFSMTACTSVASLPSPFGPGVEYSSCKITWVPDGQELAEIRFQPYTMPEYEADPIVWTD